MNELPSVGIIGLGTIGKALYDDLRAKTVAVRGYDLCPELSRDTFEQVVARSTLLFLALPTPLRETSVATELTLLEVL